LASLGVPLLGGYVWVPLRSFQASFKFAPRSSTFSPSPASSEAKPALKPVFVARYVFYLASRARKV